MARRYKVWGTSVFINGNQVRAVVKAQTKKRAVEIFNEKGLYLTMGAFNNYGSETGNTIELDMAVCDGLIVATSLMGKDFKEYI